MQVGQRGRLAQLEVLASKLTVGETYLFREPQAFEALREHVVPELAASRRPASSPVAFASSICRSYQTRAPALSACQYARLPAAAAAQLRAELTPEALGIDPAPRLKTLKVVEPPKRKSGVKVKSVAELVDKLRNEAKVI